MSDVSQSINPISPSAAFSCTWPQTEIGIVQPYRLTRDLVYVPFLNTLSLAVDDVPNMVEHAMNGLTPHVAWQPLTAEGIRFEDPNCFAYPHAGDNRLRPLCAGRPTGQTGIAVSKGRVGVPA